MSTPNATSITYTITQMSTHPMGGFGMFSGIVGTAVLPAGQAECVVSNVGQIRADTIIHVMPLKNSLGSSTVPIMEHKYNNSTGALLRVTGDNGSFNVIATNTTPPGADEPFAFRCMNP